MKLGKWCVAGIRLLPWSVIAFAQDPEAARLERYGDQGVLTADSSRPVDSAAKTLAKEFGVRVNVEDPPYVFYGDIAELTVEVPRPVRVPKGGRLEVRFALGPNGRPADVPGLVKAIPTSPTLNSLLVTESTLMVTGSRWFPRVRETYSGKRFRYSHCLTGASRFRREPGRLWRPPCL